MLDGSARLIDPLPGGIGRSGLVVDGRVPPRAVRGEGCRVLDDTGRWLIDAHNNFTVLVHGHGYRPVEQAVTACLRSGLSCVGLPNAFEHELAVVLAERIQSVEQVRFTNTGTEAIQTAIRLARATTGRSTIVGVAGAYHGSSDPALSIFGGEYRAGVPEQVSRLARRVPVGDVATLESEIDAAGDDLALVLVDLMANYTGLLRLSEEFIGTARRLCDERGALLAFDEVVSFRHHVGGMQALYSVAPDLTVLGKVIGGGLPIGAVGGEAEAMALLDATRPGSLHSSGTFSGNPLSMTAGLTALADFDEAAITRLNSLGDRLRSRFVELSPPQWEMRGYGSLARPVFVDGRPVPPSFFWNLIEHGVLSTGAPLVVLSTAMDEGVIDEIVDALLETAATVDAELS